MRDQAAQLRNLVLRASREAKLGTGALPNVQWLMGAERQVGATTLAIGLAQILADSGYRVVLINGQPNQEAFAKWTSSKRVDPDWLGRRQEIHEVMQAVHAGLQVVGSIGAQDKTEESESRCHWLHRQLGTLRPHADLVIIESSSVDTVLASHLAEWANDATVVTSTSDRSVMNCYASIKALEQAKAKCKLNVLVNRAKTIQDAQEAGARLVHSCQRFLRASPTYSGGIVEETVMSEWIEHTGDMEVPEEGAALTELRRIGLQMVGEVGRGQSAA